MFLIHSPFTKAAYNIALEEYLLKSSNQEYFILYVDEPSVVVGKHQNTMGEINYKFIEKNNIDVVRRISGGGTVFHDLGNLNFIFITNSWLGGQIDFKKYTSPIICTLRRIGINACLEGKNDIRVDGLKVSGNAEHVYKNRVLHHGTLLVNSNLIMLSEGLKVVAGRYTDNAVKSIRSKVANLNTFQRDLNIDALKHEIVIDLEKSIHIEEYILSEEDKAEVTKRVIEKFSTWDWNYAYSPRYIFHSKINVEGSDLNFDLNVENGVIRSMEMETFQAGFKNLEGLKHEYYSIKNFLLTELQVQNKEIENIIWAFF